LNVQHQRLAAWREELRNYPRPALAIAWDEGSALSLSNLVAALPEGGTCVLLVSGRSTAELEGKRNVLHAGPRLKDYDDLAALLSTVDAVILPDGPAAHLAGAVGAPGVIFSKAGHFAWTAEEAPSPWYPTLRVTQKAESAELSHLLLEALA
jgi:ADP-heptose:LPS heptosyltransferase